MPYPKRLIEVDLPIKRISAHARREKSIRHGHISTLHIWWARRPLAACRAVLCASLWPDPADDNCPKEFIEFAKSEMLKWSDNDHLQLLSKESAEHFIKVNHDKKSLNNLTFLRQLLLDFIADFANWDSSFQPEFLDTSRALTQSAHLSLGGQIGTKPLVVDPFAGGGSIPLEALRVGADSFASDLNPLPILINKVQLEYIPKFGNKLVEHVKKWGEIINEKVIKELQQYYPSIQNPDSNLYIPQIQEVIKKQGQSLKFKQIKNENSFAYLWARTVICEGPNCGTEIPLIRSNFLAKKGKRSIGFKIIPKPKEKRVEIEIINGFKSSDEQSTVKRGTATCPCCGFVTPVASVRKQMKLKNGGANNSKLLCIVSTIETIRTNGKKEELYREQGRFYRLPTSSDLNIFKKIDNIIDVLRKETKNGLKIIPDEPINEMSGVFNVPIYGHNTWGSLFSNRQLLSLITLSKFINEIEFTENKEEVMAVRVLLNFAFGRCLDKCASIVVWHIPGEKVEHVFGRQALPMVWDFAEANILSDIGWRGAVEWVYKVCENLAQANNSNGTVSQASATNHPLADDSVDAVITDPPYYNAVPYSDLSDFFFVWLKRNIGDIFPELFKELLAPKKEEVCEMAGWDSVRYPEKDKDWYEAEMQKAMAETRRITKPNGISVVVFAHKSTDGWEAQLKAMIDAGWIFTGSWPIDTEMATRLRARNSAALASSVHLVCRPRESEDGSLIQNQIGDWRDVQEELPIRIHEWMPRLAAEGVAGADAIFACLGPALEIFSRYTKVVQAGSEREISLREYLEKVWAAVSQEALNMVFSGGDAQGLEEDARLTAMWLWTLTAGTSDNDLNDEDVENDDENQSSGKIVGGFTLEYDTARKIAQGLGANLEDLKTLVEVKGDKARLLPVLERASKLFGSAGIQQQPLKKKKKAQLSMAFENIETEEDSRFEMPELKIEQAGKTVLDRLHQAMLLFSTGRTEALKRFLVEDGAGKDDRFWKLAQSLTSLYPKDTDERRWVEAVQTYKKSLGF